MSVTFLQNKVAFFKKQSDVKLNCSDKAWVACGLVVRDYITTEVPLNKLPSPHAAMLTAHCFIGCQLLHFVNGSNAKDRC